MDIITNQDQWINNTLWNNYSNASSLLINLNSELINATADEIALKAGVVSAQKAAEKIAVVKNQNYSTTDGEKRAIVEIIFDCF